MHLLEMEWVDIREKFRKETSSENLSTYIAPFEKHNARALNGPDPHKTPIADINIPVRFEQWCFDLARYVSFVFILFVLS
jgi:hypothetical protein